MQEERASSNQPGSRLHQLGVILIVVIPLALVLLCGGGYMTLRWLGNLAFPSETTDVTRYDEILGQLRPSGLVNHFPATIPAHATNLKLSYMPKVLQGGGWFQVRMELPPAAVAALDARLKGVAVHQYQGGSFFEHLNAEPHVNVPTSGFHTADSEPERYAFPEHYTLYVLHAIASVPVTWDNGETFGIAVSLQSNEVIYWAEWW